MDFCHNMSIQSFGASWNIGVIGRKGCRKNVSERKGVVQKMIKEENILLVCLFILSMGFIGMIYYDPLSIIVLVAWRIDLQEDNPVNLLVIFRVKKWGWILKSSISFSGKKSKSVKIKIKLFPPLDTGKV